jgi:hypothetical protein
MAEPLLDISLLEAQSCIDCNWTPLKLSGWLRQWLIQHFSVASNITFTDLQQRIWKSDETTGILIEDVGRWRPELTEKRPALILKRQRLQGLQIGIGNRMMGGGPVDNTRERFSVLFRGAHSIFCLAGEPGEVELLAAETYREILHFAPKHVERLGLVKITPPVIEAMGILEEASQNFVVPISFSYAFWDSWEIVPKDTSLLKKADLALTLS